MSECQGLLKQERVYIVGGRLWSYRLKTRAVWPSLLSDKIILYCDNGYNFLDKLKTYGKTESTLRSKVNLHYNMCCVS
jgi:hypothetical protein